MIEGLAGVSDKELEALLSAFRTERLTFPPNRNAIERIFPGLAGYQVLQWASHLATLDISTKQAAAFLETLIADRSRAANFDNFVDLVVTGPESESIPTRDTEVVVRELFSHAKSSVLVAGYSVFNGKSIFGALADRIEVIPQLKTRLLLDVQRGQGDAASSDREIVTRFLRTFKSYNWPAGKTVPEIYHYPLSLKEGAEKAVLHAKCVVIDETTSFVSSANFTEAAQRRNIEVGVLIRHARLSERLVSHFNALIKERKLKRADY